MEIRDLLAVARLADLRNFTTTAEALHITQPTLSRIIAALEEELGVILFRRGWNGVEATAMGELVSHHARQIVGAIEDAADQAGLPPAQRHKFQKSLSFSLLEVIDAVRRNGGASPAASELGRSQPSISRAISDFQKYSGLVIFDRARHGLTALPAASVLSDLLSILRTQVERMRNQIQQQKGHVTGRIAIGVLPFSGQDIIPRVFAQISLKYPLVRLVFVPGTYTGLVDALRLGEIEGFVGVMRGYRCPADLRESRLFDEKFTIVARKDHPVHQAGRDLHDLERETWLVPPHGSPVRAFFEQLCARYDISPPVQTCEIQFFSAVEEMLSAGDAIAMQTYSDARLQRLRPDLRQVAVELPENTVPIALTTSPDTPPSPIFEEFLRLIQIYAQEFR